MLLGVSGTGRYWEFRGNFSANICEVAAASIPLDVSDEDRSCELGDNFSDNILDVAAAIMSLAVLGPEKSWEFRSEMYLSRLWRAVASDAVCAEKADCCNIEGRLVPKRFELADGIVLSRVASTADEKYGEDSEVVELF